MTREIVLQALIAHFKSVVEANAELPFAKTGVHLPVKAFEGYADAVASALATSNLLENTR